MQIFKNIIKCVCFFLGLAVLLAAASFVLFPKDNRSEFGMRDIHANGILAENNDTIDVLVIGDSLTYSAISPMMWWRDYGYTGYVCGTPGQAVYQTYSFLAKALQTQTPKVVIMETDNIFVSYGGADDWNNSLASSIGGFLPVFEYHNRWKTLSGYDFIRMPDFTNNEYMKGFIYNATIVPCNTTNYVVPTDKRADIKDMQSFYLSQIIDLCKSKEIPLLFVSVPSPYNWTYAKHNAISDIALQNGLAYYDLNLELDKLQLNWKTDMRDDGDHMNYFGAKKITPLLGAYLKENYNLPDHRQDSEYASWNNSLKSYEKKVGES